MNGILPLAKKLSPILLSAGAGMMVFAFLMPWWGITVTKPDLPKAPTPGDADFVEKAKELKEAQEEFAEKQKRANRIRNRNKRWYDDMRVNDYLEIEFDDADKDETTFTVRLWGWNTGTGITAFILGLFILPLGIVHIFLVPFRRWSWIGSYVAAIMGLVVFILGMVFYFGSPGKNSELIAQGVGLSPGPFLVISGSFLVLVTGVFGGVIGLMEFIKGLKSDARPRRRPKSPPPEFDDDEGDSAPEFDGADDENRPRDDDGEDF